MYTQQDALCLVQKPIFKDLKNKQKIKRNIYRSKETTPTVLY